MRPLIPDDRDGDIAREIQAHLDLEAEEGMAQGATEAEARRTAVRAFGNVTRTREDVRDVWRRAWLDDLRQDVRYSVRALGRSPGFAATALLVLALGIGTNAAIYQVLDALRLQPLPVTDPDSLAIVELADLTRWRGRRASAHPALSNPLWELLRDRQETFERVLAWAGARFRIDDAGGRPADGLFVSGGFFETLGVRPLAGRLIAPDDDEPGCRAPVVVVSAAFARRRFGDPAAAIGARLPLDGGWFNVVGVTPPSFQGPEVGRSFDIAIPLCGYPQLGRESGWLHDSNLFWLTVMARLRPGTTLAASSARIRAASASWFDETMPTGLSSREADDYRSLRLRATPGRAGVSALRARYADPLLALFVATGLVLVVACTNLGSLMLARASARERELVLRLALGASRGRLVRQLLVESTVLALAGGAAGLALAAVLGRGLAVVIGAELDLGVSAEPRLLAFVAATTVLTCITFGLVPAWRASAPARRDVLGGGYRHSAGARALRLRQSLVVLQLAASVVLLVGALLFLSTLRNLLSLDTGFTTTGVDIVRLDLARVHEPRSRDAAISAVLERLRAAPGVAAAAEVRHVPLDGTGTSVEVQREGAAPGDGTTVRLNAVSDGFFETLGVRVTAGRAIDARDGRASPRVAMVNPAFVARLGLPPAPVGRRVVLDADGQTPLPTDIVGVVSQTSYLTLREDPVPTIFVPIRQIRDPRPYADLLVRASRPGAVTVSAIAAAVSGADSRLGVDVRPFASLVGTRTRGERLLAELSTALAILAAVVAVVGLGGLQSYLVSMRTHEIGVRLALGARRRQITGLVMRQALRLLVIGLALGVGLSWALAGLARSLVFGIAPRSAAALLVASGVLAALALAASYLPARRAGRVNPLTAVRSD